MDVRILETERRFATVRILTSLAFGRLVRSPLYHELRVPEFSFRAVDGPTPLAHDGELAEKMDEASFSVRYRALQVFRPLP
jgi:diacylglycerol kinase family enzyme